MQDSDPVHCYFYCTGRIPLDPKMTQCLEEGKSYVDAYIGAPAQVAMADIVHKLLSKTENIETDTQTNSKT